jgi:hypothetical protein
MAKGWIIRVTYFHDGFEHEQRYDVAIAEPEQALAAVKRRVAYISGARLSLEEELFDATFFGLGLAPGDVRPRVRYRR